METCDASLEGEKMILEVRNVCKNFGGLRALVDVSFHVQEGEILAIIGPNGAGKTTLLNVINGLQKATSGSVIFAGERISGLPPNAVCARGLARTFQIAQPFRDMTALDNVLTAGLCRTSDIGAARAEGLRILEFCGLGQKRGVLARHLTTIDQRRLELAKALATRPKLVLLDETMAGLNVTECDLAIELVRKIRSEGITIVMVEHVMRAVMALGDRIVVLNQGAKLAEGTPGEIAHDQRVIRAYLGEGYKSA